MESNRIGQESQKSSIQMAIQGEAGSNSHLAALEYAEASGSSGSARIVPCATSVDVFEMLAAGGAECAVLPIENTLHGSVFEHYDLLLEYRAKIVGERMLRVRHNLIVRPGVALAEVRRVLSHPVALSQCRRWLRAHAELEAAPSYDTAGSVKQIMEAGWTDAAAIAPELAAQQYGAEVLVRGVEDHVDNFTRFYVLTRENGADWPENANKVSLAFRLEHRPGALLGALGAFSGAGLNLTRIESRPVPGRPWEYIFFLDVRFERDEEIGKALQELERSCQQLRVLGRYRSAGVSSGTESSQSD